MAIAMVNASIMTIDTSMVVSNPKVAFNWSLIPGLSQGQLYNENYIKACGLFLLQAYSLEKVLRYERFAIGSVNTVEKIDFIKDRNDYFWQFLGFYFLGVVDAYVESHLEGFPSKNMEIE